MNLMRSMCVLILLVAMGCSTSVKLVESGPIEAQVVRDGKKYAPILMQYKFAVPSDKHIIYFFDQDKHRYDIRVPGDLDTTKGIIFYLPAENEYAVVGIYIERIRGQDFLFGDNLDLFKLDAGKVNALPFFALAMGDDREGFLASERPHDAVYLTEVEKKYGKLPGYRPVKIQLLHHFKIR